MINFIKHIKDRIQGKAIKGQRRSPKWRKVRAKHLVEKNECYICKSKKKLEVHHIIPFHIAPDLELEPNNLITLCENKKYGINCHLLVGHLGNYRRTNLSCEVDAMTWRIKLRKEIPKSS